MVIKISTSYPEWPLKRQTPGSSGVWEGNYFVENEEIEECDLWVVCNNLIKPETTRCPEGNVVFIAGEPSSVHYYNKIFLKQFSYVITSQKEIKHPGLIISQQALPWHIGRIMRDGQTIGFSRSFDELLSAD
jgi:hypothetical protein